jgi:hypothetical protein
MSYERSTHLLTKIRCQRPDRVEDEPFLIGILGDGLHLLVESIGMTLGGVECGDGGGHGVVFRSLFDGRVEIAWFSKEARPSVYPV